ncbi:hypothetical protein ACI781_06675 [Blastococcus sp. SYSU D00695]
MPNASPKRFLLWTALRRFGAVALVVGVLAGLGAALLASRLSSPSYVAEGTVLVPLAPAVTQAQPVDPTISVPTDPRPTNAYEAERLAKNYAGVLVEDPAVLQAMSDRTQIPVDDLRTEAAPVNLPGTAIIRITYTGESEAEVLGYFDGLRDLLSAPTAISPNIAVTTLVPLRLPTEVIEQEGVSPLAPLLGVAAGLLLGLGAAVFLERSLPQLRTAADVHALTSWPVLTFSRTSGASRYETAVLRVLATAPSVREVAVVSAGRFAPRNRATVADQLRAAELRLRASGRLPEQGTSITWHDAGRVPDDGTAERRVQDADAVVLVLPRHAPTQPAAAAVDRLADLDAGPVIVLLGPAPQPSQATRPAPAAPPAEGALPATPVAPAEAGAGSLQR